MTTADGFEPIRSRGPATAATNGETIGELLVAVGRGDRVAFSRLHDLLGDRVLGVANSITRDRGLAQDTTQEVFLEIWHKGARFDPALGSAVAWILMLARSRAIDRVRHTEAFRRRESWYAAHRLERDSDTVSEAVLHRLDVSELPAMLTSLSPQQLEAIRLIYFAGHSHFQASTILGIPLSTFKTRVRDALIKLRRTADVST